jgi:DNA topoisomerase-2
VSFVNGIATRRGGKHVEHVAKEVLAAFCAYAKRKAKLELAPHVLRDAVTWFVNATVVNPSFDTQSKESLTTPPAKFGSLPEFKGRLVEGLARVGLLAESEALLDARSARDARRTDGRKRSTLVNIPKLQDAKLAGTAKSRECTLILTEGDSAAASALAGLAVVGNDRFGVFPLRGKPLNSRDVTAEKRNANAEYANLKKILGLRSGAVFKDVGELRYGRVLILSDQDVDGFHIKALVANMLACEWPSLLQLGFLCCLATPLLKVMPARGGGGGGDVLNFYSQSEFDGWKAAAGGDAAALRGRRVKYFKGLGTSDAKESRQYFADMTSINYAWDDRSADALDMAFNKKRADDRKAWLATYEPARHIPIVKGGATVPFSRLVDDELMHFSMASNERAIPHVMDGLKPSQRKVLWACFKRNLTAELKVAQLAGYVGEHAAYHHGEASLNATIIGMAQNFTGSNNVNLLQPLGQFGTRLQGGEDAASPRYIFTQLDAVARLLFPRADDASLRQLHDEGLAIEPACYKPVLPMLLVNGAVGIGTGYSTLVLPHNPADLVGVLRLRLRGAVPTCEGVALTPWWRGFRGTVAPLPGAAPGPDGAPRAWLTTAVYSFEEDDDKCLVRITELPVGVWTNDAKETFESLLEEGGAKGKDAKGKDAKDAKDAKEADGKAPRKAAEKKEPSGLLAIDETVTDEKCTFVLRLTQDAYDSARAFPSEFLARFRLTSTWRETNMLAFQHDGKLRHFETVGEMLEAFYAERLAAYGARKAAELARLSAELVEVNARLAFVRAVLAGTLRVMRVKDEELLAGLLALGVPPLSAPPDEPPTLAAFEYLLRTRVDRLTAKSVAALEAEAAAADAERAALDAMTPEALWLADLDAVEAGLVGHEERRLERLAAADDEPKAKAAAAGAKRKPRAAPSAAHAKKARPTPV